MDPGNWREQEAGALVPQSTSKSRRIECNKTAGLKTPPPESGRDNESQSLAYMDLGNWREQGAGALPTWTQVIGVSRKREL